VAASFAGTLLWADKSGNHWWVETWDGALTNAEQPKVNGIVLGPGLSQEQAETIFALGKQAVVFALLAQATRPKSSKNGQTGIEN
jgi:hypothetical protein